MIGHQLRAWDVLDERVLEVFAGLPRERFVPAEWRKLAYADTGIPVGAGKQLAAPKMQGRALQAVLPQPGERALEIGSGTGYLTACLARLAGHVIAVELHPELVSAARENLAALAIDNATIIEGDGLAMEFDGRFDVICVNGSMPAGHEQLQERLEVGGRMFVVTGKPPVMHALRIERTGESAWTTASIFETCLPPLENVRQPMEFVF